MKMQSLLLLQTKVFTFVIVFIYTICSVASAQNNLLENEQNLIKNYREKIYVHTDKDKYTAGDDVWFKVYLVDANSHQTTAISKVVYVNLINSLGEVLKSKCLKIVGGTAAADFNLPIDLMKGNYTLRAYTKYMQNFNNEWFFHKTLYVNEVRSGKRNGLDTIDTIVNSKSELIIGDVTPDVQFFPEGGYLVDGMLNRVGVKALDINGESVDVRGSVFDDDDRKVIEFSTLKFGLGSFNFVPEQGKQYRAKVIVNDGEFNYALPLSKKRGLILRVLEMDKCLSVVVRSSLVNGVSDVTLVARQNGEILFQKTFDENNKLLKVEFPKDSLDEGIIQFTLLHQQDNPVCERLFFYQDCSKNNCINLSVEEKEYEQRERVDVELSSLMQTTSSVLNNMSISVANSYSYTKEFADDIRSYLLLNSELKGRIEQPGFYFYSNHPKKKELLDNLMMTQGWRRYIWKTLEDERIKNIEIEPETGFSVSGDITRLFNRKKRAEAKLSLICSNSHEFTIYETETDKNGSFMFNGIDIIDTSKIIIQAKKTNELSSKMNYNIRIDSLLPPSFIAQKEFISDDANVFSESYPNSALTMEQIDSLMRLKNDDIWLEEIVIKASRKDEKVEKRIHYREPNYNIDFGENNFSGNMTVMDAIYGRFPSDMPMPISVFQHPKGGGGSEGHNIRTSGKGIKYLLDGFQVDEDVILSIPIQTVDFVDILKGPKANLIPGARAGNTIIAVYTLDTEDVLDDKQKDISRGVVNFIHPGFCKAREFYSPVYTSEDNNENMDRRNTLYWNPNIELSSGEKTKLSFFTGDLEGAYLVRVEGITSGGYPVSISKIIEVK